jgi:HD-like signal output (HDOD) protein/AmiR/NasT family two-component response regulator
MVVRPIDKNRAFFMASIMLISENQRETQVLKLAFEQKTIKVVCCTPDYRNYIKILQYLPDVVFIEFPKIASAQLHFVEILKSQKKTKGIPIISYGDKIDDATKKGLLDKGILYYINRPLKFSIVLNTLEKNLKYLNKGLNLPKEQPSDMAKDIDLILGKQTPAAKKIEIMTSHIVKVMAFPFTVAKVLKLADSEKSAAADLAKVIQADPVISAQLLKISNSVLFASMNRRIGNVKDAIIRVGFKETRRLVMSMSVMKLFGETDKNIGLDRKAFWFHSLVCGIISERLARQMGTVNTEEAFLAGILHDFGILLLDEFFPTIFSRILEDTADKNTQFILSEKTMLGITHNDIVGQLFAQWKLPDAVTEGVIGQYQFGGYENNLDSPSKKIALCVGVSDILAKTVGFGKECDRYITPVANWVFESVRMPVGISDVFLEDINHQIVLYREFLKLDTYGADGSAQEKEIAGKQSIGVINHAKDIFVPPLLYLKNEGYETVSISLNSKKAAEVSVHEVVLWTGAGITPDIILEASKMVKKEGQAAVVVFIDENTAALSQTTNLPGVRFIKKSFDLRQLDIQS